MADEVTRELHLPATAEEVWEAVTDPEGLRGWLADEAELELEPGGEARFRLPDGERREGFVEEASPPERLAFWWRASEEPDEPLTRVEFSLTEVEGGTVLRVVESRPAVALETLLLPTQGQFPGPEMRSHGPLALAR
jgi:uncharacterized protein YndB with AHSA1/START domain